MKWFISVLCVAGCAAAAWAVPAVRPFEDYQVIMDRKPFGTPPDRSMEPERVVPVSESFAAQMVLSGIYELDDGNLRVAVTDKRDNSYFALMVGETNEAGIALIDADYEKEEATLQKGDETVVLSMSNPTGGQVLSASERQEKVKEATERRLSYAERRRQRQLERQQRPPEATQPVLTGEALEQHLQEYQMEVIRTGLPPLPVQLTPERDAQLVAEGFLPPVDENGYEIEEEEPAAEEYLEEGN